VARALLCAIVASVGCGTVSALAAPEAEARQRPDPATIRNILALDCQHVTPADVALSLARGPAPRIILLQGSVAVVTMQPFAEFLIAMGYPAQQIRNPRDGGMSEASFGDSLRWAGVLAWYYEADGMMPMLIGHSQGGMMAIRILYELNGTFHESLPVWNPMTDTAEERTTIRDPLTGAARPVKGLKVGYAAAIATGKLPRVLFGQWDMISRLRRIPDTVDDFTGFSIPWDPIAGTFADPEPYVALGTAHVRNVVLPARTSHIGIPLTAQIAANEFTRAWIDNYTPETAASPPDEAGVDITNLMHAADIWYSVKVHWCRSAQSWLQARERP